MDKRMEMKLKVNKLAPSLEDFLVVEEVVERPLDSAQVCLQDVWVEIYAGGNLNLKLEEDKLALMKRITRKAYLR